MKPLLVFISIIALFFIACDDEVDKSFLNSGWTPDPNDLTPPTVNIIIPADSTVVPKDSVRILVVATDDTGIRNVSFRIDGILVSEDQALPYEYYWDIGTLSQFTFHEICATARDNGNRTNFDCVIVQIGQ